MSTPPSQNLMGPMVPGELSIPLKYAHTVHSTEAESKEEAKNLVVREGKETEIAREM